MAKDTEKTAPAPEPVIGTEKEKGMVEVEFDRNYFLGGLRQKKRLVTRGETAFVTHEQLASIQAGKPPYGHRVKK